MTGSANPAVKPAERRIDPPDPAGAARAARAELRSRQLLEAAARLMEREGSQAVSMQALADEAGVSVGLIYRYFGSKDDILLAVIVNVLDAFAERVPAAISAAGADPARQLAAAFGAYCEVIDAHRHAAVLTYRESKALDGQGRSKVKDLELATIEPLRAVLRRGVDDGLFTGIDVDLVATDLILLAHAWALKHWHFDSQLDLAAYVQAQTAFTLRAVMAPGRFDDYPDLMVI